MAEKKKTFEESLGRLEEIVKVLENGNAPLGDSLKLFEEGVALVRACSEELDAAEKKIIELTSGDGNDAE